MNEQTKTNRMLSEISIQSLLRVLLSKAWLITLVTLASTALVCIITMFCVTPKYEATAMFYVNNNDISLGSAASGITSSDLRTSRSLVESYIVILGARETLEEVIAFSETNHNYLELKQMIVAEPVDETEIFQVRVTDTDPADTEQIANAIAQVLPKRIDEIIEGTSSKIIETAVVPSKQSSPSLSRNMIMGFLLGFSLIVGIITLKKIFDMTVHKEEDILQIGAYPILAAVPDMFMGSGKAGEAERLEETASFTGECIPPAAAEAYKLLRTKIQFSFADDNRCHVIGVSSALAGEGKSTTSINLAHTLAQLDQKVLLIDCDLRRPSVALKLQMQRQFGLSDCLVGTAGLEQVFHHVQTEAEDISVIPAGSLPPNPTELLNSAQMEQLIGALKTRFDYIIIDLPPVSEVGDALVAAKLVDGILLTVRQDYCDLMALEETVHQFEFVKANILGFLMTCTTASNK